MGDSQDLSWTDDDREFMRVAIAEANNALLEQEVPVGYMNFKSMGIFPKNPFSWANPACFVGALGRN